MPIFSNAADALEESVEVNVGTSVNEIYMPHVGGSYRRRGVAFILSAELNCAVLCSIKI